MHHNFHNASDIDLISWFQNVPRSNYFSTHQIDIVIFNETSIWKKYSKCKFSKLATSGNRTRASRVAGENSTTEPTLLDDPNSKLIHISNLMDWNRFIGKQFKWTRSIYLTLYFEVLKQRWFSGRILACHAGGPGSIPGRCKFCKIFNPKHDKGCSQVKRFF